jgi:predicted ATPase
MMVGHRMVGIAMMLTGQNPKSLAHYNKAIALYDPVEHRPVAMRFGQDIRVSTLTHRSLALWMLGYPNAALADSKQALIDARDIGQAATLMFALFHASLPLIFCGDRDTAALLAQELVQLAKEKDAIEWKATATVLQGILLSKTGVTSDATGLMTSGLAARRAAGSTAWFPSMLSDLACAYAQLGQFDNAWRSIRDALAMTETNKERWCEAEINRIAGEIALKSLTSDPEKAEAYFNRALDVARKQQAKYRELRAAMSLARLWRDQGKRDEARNLLAPVYGWFTEGFDTLDLKEAKVLLGELSS